MASLNEFSTKLSTESVDSNKMPKAINEDISSLFVGVVLPLIESRALANAAAYKKYLDSA